jgi:hypothetical protein
MLLIMSLDSTDLIKKKTLNTYRRRLIWYHCHREIMNRNLIMLHQWRLFFKRSLMIPPTSWFQEATRRTIFTKPINTSN